MSLKVVEGLPVEPIVITYAHMNTQNIRGALSKLCATPTLPQKTAYWVGRINQVLETKMGDIAKEYQKMVKDFCELDSNGVPLIDENTRTIKILKDKEKEFEVAHNAFIARTIELEWSKLPAHDFEKAGLTPNDLLALEPILQGLG